VLPDAASEEMSPRQVVSLGGGADALTYLVRCPGRDVVVKLNDRGLEAEARALRAWKAHTRWVPDVLGVGTVPSTRGRPVKYLVLGALVNDEGDVVETAAEYLDRSPAGARDVGRELGAELQRMHQARCDTGFGNFADSLGAVRTYGTWDSYLEEFFMQHADYARGLGIRDHQIEKACAFIRQAQYVGEARYLHGDVSIRNIAMRSYDPIRISLFDPNPLGGDPSWDIAPMTNNVEFNERRHRADDESAKTLMRDREVLTGFWESYPHVIDDRALLTAQLVQALLQAEHREDASERGETDDLDVEVTHEFIRHVVDRMSA
jgi:fructosamine-3-kinase